MRRGTIYSSFRNLPKRGPHGSDPSGIGENPVPGGTGQGQPDTGAQRENPPEGRRNGTVQGGSPGFASGLKGWLHRYERLLLPLSGVFLSLLVLFLTGAYPPAEGEMNREALDTAIRESLDNLPPERSRAAEAHEVIAPSVVRITRLGESDNEDVQGVGTGVVIDSSGIILTSLHVVAGAERIGVRFADGFESEAEMVSADASNDLAVIKVEIIPEGVPPAAIVSTDGLSLGDEVVALGHPFGIGPSVSYGVVSGLDRRYAARDGETIFDNLIQFDAAANPGNSGGPLVNRYGEVLGIVSSIYNPTEQRVFIGIGFAVPIETAAAAAGESPF